MTKINIEEWFFSSKRWEKEHECLNMENINEKPCTYEGSLEDWIKEVTTFIFFIRKNGIEFCQSIKPFILNKNRKSVTD